MIKAKVIKVPEAWKNQDYNEVEVGDTVEITCGMVFTEGNQMYLLDSIYENEDDEVTNYFEQIN